MNIERDKFLTEAMGEKWFCHKATCGVEHFTDGRSEWMYTTRTTNDFSTWDGFGKLWKWVRNSPRYNEIVINTKLWSGYHAYSGIAKMDIPDSFIDPDKFADVIYEFLKENK
jgi:hypothetical protein